jgi:hypothetical protein
LMAKGDVLEGELTTGSEGSSECENDDFDHSIMLYSACRNRNGTKADGLFGRHRGQSTLCPLGRIEDHPRRG